MSDLINRGLWNWIPLSAANFHIILECRSQFLMRGAVGDAPRTDALAVLFLRVNRTNVHKATRSFAANANVR